MRQSIVRVIARCAVLATLPVLLLACGEGRAATAISFPSNALASASIPGPTDREVASFVRLMNAHRKSLGLPALAWDSRVAAVAQAHSRDMSERHYFSHTTPGGRSPWDRLAAGGVTYSRAGENIAWGQRTGSEAFAAWINSRGHRANIENGSYTRHGVGKVGNYWTEVFIRPAGAPSSSR